MFVPGVLGWYNFRKLMLSYTLKEKNYITSSSADIAFDEIHHDRK